MLNDENDTLKVQQNALINLLQSKDRELENVKRKDFISKTQNITKLSKILKTLYYSKPLKTSFIKWNMFRFEVKVN